MSEKTASGLVLDCSTKSVRSSASGSTSAFPGISSESLVALCCCYVSIMPRAQNDASAPSRKASRPGKPYRLTCSACRKKKQKCDGEQPQCRICQAYGEPCHYDKTPPMTQVLAMASRIEELERMLSDAKHNGSPLLTQELAEKSTSNQTEYTEAGSQEPRSLPSVFPNANSAQEHSPYYSTTSAVQAPIVRKESASRESGTPALAAPSLDLEQLQFWEHAAAKTAATLLHMPHGKVSHLLQFHWTWIHPVFMFVNKAAFLRDAATGGAHASPLLINVVCLHSTRFTERNLSEDLLARSRLLLGQVLHQEPSVPTVQALLQLSAREIGNGSLSLAWIYCGMAFRMAVDMGIFTRQRSSRAGLEQVVKEQLAWSCYLWDKAVSLYLGRTPTLPVAPNFEPPIGDDLAEKGLWTPFPSKPAQAADLEPMRSYTSSCFANFCILATIITEILLSLYAKNTPTDVSTFVQQTTIKLETWRAKSPRHIVTEASAEQCPPPHILTQNLLFHATTILLRRPFSQVASSRSACRRAAEAVEHLLLHFERAFGFEHVTYLIAYSAYTAATVAVLDMHDGIPGSQGRVNTYLRALYGIRASCPGIQFSIDIIVKSFDQKPSAAGTPREPTEPNGGTLEATALPAFPIFDYSDPAAYSWPNQGDLISPAFGDLDPFAIEWSRMPLETFANLDSGPQDMQMQF
ncbi:hypothetical protein AC579_4091 [Pseudocercospora musae]|uniref:Zn(2)-C6 fungal-type domain-containing protein n=1 Tax=Pseudocercospora musae TaxID=113226 RepID=A0A139IJT1_9PEZI|nr:hypothetical protein AC579_4091 [Pseudocercospora musae]